MSDPPSPASRNSGLFCLAHSNIEFGAFKAYKPSLNGYVKSKRTRSEAILKGRVKKVCLLMIFRDVADSFKNSYTDHEKHGDNENKEDALVVF